MMERNIRNVDTENYNAINETEKKPKNRFWIGVLTGVLVTSFAGLLIIGAVTFLMMMGRISVGSQPLSGSRGTEQSQELNFQKIKRKTELIQSLINKYYLFDIDTEKEEAGIYKGMLESLGDKYTTYYDAKEYDTLMENTSGTYCGIGALISQNLETKVVTIMRVFRKSPAEKAGLMKGDIIVSANGVESTSIDLDMLVQEQIRGEKGTTTKLSILRGDETIECEVERQEVDVDTVDYQMMKDGRTGYMMVAQFDIVTPEQFRTGLEELKEQGMEQLIIDLRGNPGGVLDCAVDMLAYLLPEDQYDGTLVYTEDRNGKGEKYFCKDGKIRTVRTDKGIPNPEYPKTDDHELNIPIVILLDEGSASASEVFSGAMRDYGRAKLVGMTSYGKGIVQDVISLGDGTAVKITTSHYYTPSGFDLHGKGLEPDVEIKFKLPENYKEEGLTLENDNQVQKALDVLNGVAEDTQV